MIKPWGLGIGTVMVTISAGMGLAQDIEIPRTASGRPDLQGIWTNKTLTPLTRPKEFAETRALSQQQVQRLEGDNQVYLDAEYADSDPHRAAGFGAQAGDDCNTEDGYNEFWKDVGTRIQMIDGEYRASIIIDPADGQIPYAGDPRTRFRRDPGAPGRSCRARTAASYARSIMPRPAKPRTSACQSSTRAGECSNVVGESVIGERLYNQCLVSVE